MSGRKSALTAIGKVTFGRKTIRFSVIRSARRKKTIALSIEPAGDVLVRAPVRTPHSRLAHIVKSRAEWIIRKQRSLENLPVPFKREFVSGESFSYLGRHLRLKVLRNHNVEEPVVRMYRGRLEVNLNAASTDGKSAKIKYVIIQWYRVQAARRIPERVRIYAEKMGFREPEVLIRDQRRIWGSCSSKGVLRFNWRIIMAPMSLVNYLVVHELCHLKHRDHSKSFWKSIGMTIPDYEKRKERLRISGIEYQF